MLLLLLWPPLVWLPPRTPRRACTRAKVKFSPENSHLQDQELLAKNIKVGGGKLVAAAYDDAEYHCSKEELEMRTHSRFLGSREGGGGQIHIIGQERLLLRISHP